MTTDQEVDAFLSHWGVKGMKWGVRKDRGVKGAVSRQKARNEAFNAKKDSRSGKQKAGIAAATVGSYALGVNFALALTRSSALSIPLGAIAGVAAYNKSRSFVDARNDVRIKDISKKN